MTEYCFLTSIYKNTKADEMKICVESMVSQTIAPSQIVVVVDGPIDGTLDEYIKELEINQLFTVLRLENNVGLGEALKFGTEVCLYEIVARMDTDDICVLDRMEKQLKVLEEDESISIVGSNIAEFIGTKDNVVSVRDLPAEHDAIVTYMKKRCPFNHMTVTFRKSEVLKAGGYMHWHYDEDSYLWARMYLAGCRFANIGENLVYARIDNDTFKRRGGKKYYLSEKALFRFMLDNKIITKKEYRKAVAMRYIIQVLLPNRLRGWLFINFMRKKPQMETMLQEKTLKKMNLEEIKANLLEMLDDITNVCQENGIRFFLSGGTLLGAVRHQGFIPWDDDIDLHMPRPDYEKFIQIYKSQDRKYKLYAPIFDEKYRYSFVKLINPKTFLIEKEAVGGVPMGVFIDIFPLDGMGDTIENARKIMKKMKWPIYLNLGLNITRHRKTVSLLKNLMVSVCFILGNLSGGNKKIARRIDKIAKTYSFENSKYAGEFVDEIGERRINEREYYDQTVYLDFEGRKCPAPYKYHEILTNFYGDYMQLPPVEKRVLVHNYDAFILEE